MSNVDNSALSAGMLSFLTLLSGASAVFISGGNIESNALTLHSTIIIAAIIGGYIIFHYQL